MSNIPTVPKVTLVSPYVTSVPPKSPAARGPYPQIASPSPGPYFHNKAGIPQTTLRHYSNIIAATLSNPIQS